MKEAISVKQLTDLEKYLLNAINSNGRRMCTAMQLQVSLLEKGRGYNFDKILEGIRKLNDYGLIRIDPNDWDKNEITAYWAFTPFGEDFHSRHSPYETWRDKANRFVSWFIRVSNKVPFYMRNGRTS